MLTNFCDAEPAQNLQCCFLWELLLQVRCCSSPGSNIAEDLGVDKLSARFPHLSGKQRIDLQYKYVTQAMTHILTSSSGVTVAKESLGKLMGQVLDPTLHLGFPDKALLCAAQDIATICTLPGAYDQDGLSALEKVLGKCAAITSNGETEHVPESNFLGVLFKFPAAGKAIIDSANAEVVVLQERAAFQSKVVQVAGSLPAIAVGDLGSALQEAAELMRNGQYVVLHESLHEVAAGFQKSVLNAVSRRSQHVLEIWAGHMATLTAAEAQTNIETAELSSAMTLLAHIPMVSEGMDTMCGNKADIDAALQAVRKSVAFARKWCAAWTSGHLFAVLTGRVDSLTREACADLHALGAFGDLSAGLEACGENLKKFYDEKVKASVEQAVTSAVLGHAQRLQEWYKVSVDYVRKIQEDAGQDGQPDQVVVGPRSSQQ